MNARKKSSRKAGGIVLSGDLTISRAAEIAGLLKAYVHGNAQELRIFFKDVTAMDISCLQLLCAAHRTATALEKVLTLEMPVPDLFRQVVERAGFERESGCSFSPKTACLWSNGGSQ